ncbi:MULTISPECIES: hypothetical protein [Nostoc]|uniref:Uncharacterized protein n=1 Tax=Nostoc paludosum FACHB-159 TaxID=2692908 RepID=A0ABR8K7D6_9NOSO|nr:MULTISPECIES: hypothetical protein [Nostoc]MBD2679025.1 hypothetical protein [Nostoc sp. FACHB-857]MBD2735403.1 hypothetical protein [Nostoc paludosum FACHB-159]
MFTNEIYHIKFWPDNISWKLANFEEIWRVGTDGFANVRNITSQRDRISTYLDLKIPNVLISDAVGSSSRSAIALILLSLLMVS